MFSVDGSHRNRLFDAITLPYLFRIANNHDEKETCQFHRRLSLLTQYTYTSKILCEDWNIFSIKTFIHIYLLQSIRADVLRIFIISD
jgi:hypothetical protein